MLSCNTSPHHPSNMPTTVPLPACREGEDDGGVAKTAGRRILPTAHYFQEKICAMESVGDGHHFPSATGSTRWQTVMADDEEEEEEEDVGEEKRPVCRVGRRERRGKRRASGKEAEW
jgi:hypothetical protein